MSREIVNLLCQTFPKILQPFMEKQFNQAIITDMHYVDEPHAMIALIIFEQSWAGFAEAMTHQAMMDMMDIALSKFQEDMA
jgi:hypothetical protein